MKSLIRKITRPKWGETNSGELAGDSLKDMISRDNTLSFWRSENESTLNEIFAALGASSSSLDKLDIVSLDEETISGLGIQIKEISGDTPFTDANKYHVDLVNLSAKDIANLAIEMKRVGKFTRKQKPELVSIMIAFKDRIDRSALSESMQSSIYGHE